MKNLVGKCKYYGTEYAVIAEEQEAANMMAEDKCVCEGVKIARKKEAMKNLLEGLIGKSCTQSGFVPIEEAVHAAVETIAYMAIEGHIRKATFTVDGTQIIVTAGEKAKVTRKRVYELTEEIE